MYVVICRYCIKYQSKWKNSLRSALSQKPRKREWGCEVARRTEPRFTEAGYHVGHATRLRQYNSAVMIQRYWKHQGRSHKLIQWHFREEKSRHIAQRRTWIMMITFHILMFHPDFGWFWSLWSTEAYDAWCSSPVMDQRSRYLGHSSEGRCTARQGGSLSTRKGATRKIPMDADDITKGYDVFVIVFYVNSKYQNDISKTVASWMGINWQLFEWLWVQDCKLLTQRMMRTWLLTQKPWIN